MTEPPQRIGDLERDRAVEALREHHAAGRLTLEEFDERMEQALSARTTSDLDPLFLDLPATTDTSQALAVPASRPIGVGAAAPRQLAPEAPPAAPDPGPRWVQLVSALAFPAILIFNFATGWQFWWTMMIWVFFTPILVSLYGEGAFRRNRISGRRDRRRELR